jgi:hypothetical protein
MPFPIKICAVCSKEFELKPDKPGFANRCPACSEIEKHGARKEGARGRKQTCEGRERKRNYFRCDRDPSLGSGVKQKGRAPSLRSGCFY